MFGMWSAELAGLWREGEGDVGVKPCGCPGLSLQEAPARAALQSGIVHAGGLLNDKAVLGRRGGGVGCTLGSEVTQDRPSSPVSAAVGSRCCRGRTVAGSDTRSSGSNGV